MGVVFVVHEDLTSQVLEVFFSGYGSLCWNWVKGWLAGWLAEESGSILVMANSCLL
jgi:hypothetical protein